MWQSFTSIGRQSSEISWRNKKIKKLEYGAEAKFCMFLAPKIFLWKSPEFLDLHYKMDADIDNVAKFRGDRPRELGDPMANFKKNITSKT